MADTSPPVPVILYMTYIHTFIRIYTHISMLLSQPRRRKCASQPAGARPSTPSRSSSTWRASPWCVNMCICIGEGREDGRFRGAARPLKAPSPTHYTPKNTYRSTAATSTRAARTGPRRTPVAGTPRRRRPCVPSSTRSTRRTPARLSRAWRRRTRVKGGCSVVGMVDGWCVGYHRLARGGGG